MRWFHQYQPERFDYASRILESPDKVDSGELTGSRGLNPAGQGLDDEDASEIFFGDEKSNEG